MKENILKIYEKKLSRTEKALTANGYSVHIAENWEEARKILFSLIPEGASVGVGGSMTLTELGVIEALRNGNYNFLDRYEPGLSGEELKSIMKKALLCDVFLSSSNAITCNGELYNVDGNSNRVAPMLYGPDSVIIVAGINKLVENLDEARLRVRNIVAPANCVRLGIENPCTKFGSCCDCKVDSKICCNTVIMGKQRVPGRVKVILVCEELGF